MVSQKLLTRRQFLAFLPIVPMAVMAIKTRQSQRINTYNPKFRIGDYISHTFPVDEGNVIQTGRITAVIVYEPEPGNPKKLMTNYTYEVETCNAGDWWIGQEDSADEYELVPLTRRNPS